MRKLAPTRRLPVVPEQAKRLRRAPRIKLPASFGRFKVLGKLVPPYFRNSWHELSLTTWPSRRESWQLTGAVLIFAIVFGLAIAGVDKLLDIIFKAVVLK